MAVNYVGHRSGEVNATGNSRALFLKLYAGEVMTAFQTKNIMLDYCRVRTIKNGKSAQFIMTGKNRAAAYHTPGNELIPAARAKHTERLVTIDDLLVAHQFIPNIDEAMQHIDKFGSKHTDTIVTENKKNADRFLREVDSSSVMLNASTRFADGYEYGLGAEIGISTDKFHARGPVGLEGLTSQKYIVLGDGHIRS